MNAAFVAVHVADDPAGFTPRLLEIVASIDAQALALEPGLLSVAMEEDARLMKWLLLVVTAVAGISVVLSVASLLERRTREIGLRSALGARPSSIVSVIVKRALAQLLLGVTLSAGLITGSGTDGQASSGSAPSAKPGGDVSTWSRSRSRSRRRRGSRAAREADQEVRSEYESEIRKACTATKGDRDR